jgi:hypothetical protein
VLLTSIWMLVLTGAMASAALIAARTASLGIRQSHDSALATLSLAEARDAVLHSLVVEGRYGRWGGANASGQLATVKDVPVQITVTNEGGRLDLIAAEPELVKSFMKQLTTDYAHKRTPQEMDAAVQSILAQRDAENRSVTAIKSLEQLASLKGWTAELAACVSNDATIYTGQQRPALAYATPRVRQLFNQSVTGVSNTGDAMGQRSLAGEVLRINLVAKGAHRTQSQQLIVRITGSQADPFWIMAATKSVALGASLCPLS